MPGQPDFDTLIDRLTGDPPADLHAVFDALKRRYELSHVIYGHAERRQGMTWRGKLHHDPNPALQRLQRQHGVDALAPALNAFVDLFGPAELDLRRLQSPTGQWERILVNCGLDRPLLAFPLVPTKPGVAFLACTSARRDGWTLPVRTLLRDICLVAGLLHANLVAADTEPAQAPRAPKDTIRLTPREREVLQWVAAGKSYWEIARILDISERTIRHFMANCRTKLDAVSNKQAVAKAVAGRLIATTDSQLHNNW